MLERSHHMHCNLEHHLLPTTIRSAGMAAKLCEGLDGLVGEQRTSCDRSVSIIDLS